MTTTQLKTVAIRDVTSGSTSRGDIFRVQTTDGEYSTFNGALANQARQLIGREVMLRFTEKQVEKNGQWFTNRYYEGAEPTGNMAQGPSGPTQVTFEPPQRDSDKDLKIMRQTATKVAVLLLAYLPEDEQTPTALLDAADFLLAYYQHGQRRNEPVASEPSFYDPIPHGDEDIPF